MERRRVTPNASRLASLQCDLGDIERKEGKVRDRDAVRARN
jgi:hypothetical protein